MAEIATIFIFGYKKYALRSLKEASKVSMSASRGSNFGNLFNISYVFSILHTYIADAKGHCGLKN